MRQWVDERTYARVGDGVAWVDGEHPNGALDWLETRAMDYLVDPDSAIADESEDVLSRLHGVRDGWGLQRQGKVEFSDVRTLLLNPIAGYVRLPLPSSALESISYHGLVRSYPAWRRFDYLLSHEARHSWALQLGELDGRTDVDRDFLYVDPPSSSPELADNVFDMNGIGPPLNPEHDFLGDNLTGSSDLVLRRPPWEKAAEHNADRFATANIAGTLACGAFSWSLPSVLTTSPIATLAATLSLPSSHEGEVAGMLVLLERATSGQSCAGANEWGLYGLTTTEADGSVAMPVDSGMFRLQLVPPRECAGAPITSACAVVP